MKEITILQLGKTETLNKSFVVITENEDVLFADTVNYSKASKKEEIVTHLNEISGVIIEDFSMSFGWVGGRPNDRR
jgi:hypothetical protein